MGRKKTTFKEAYDLFKKNNCELLYSEEEFNNTYNNSNTKLNYIANCGHNHQIQLRIFKEGTYDKICPNCVYKKRSLLYKEDQSGENKNKHMKLESETIIYLVSHLEKTFDIIKTFDSCISDIIIKPKNILDDLWLGLQIKSTNTCNNLRKCYYFNIKKDYEKLFILCICYQDKKIWGFENNDVNHLKNTLQIGYDSNSKYNKFEITNNLNNVLLNKYEKLNKFSKDFLLNQLSKTTLIEYNYYKYRESKIIFINFIKNLSQGEVFDFKIGNKKVQEKVGKFKGNVNSKICNYYDFNLSKCNGKNNKKIPYSEKDNDIYWFNCKDTTKFYVIPEFILIEKGYIGKKTSIIISKENINKPWLNDYMFDYEDLEKDKEKLCKILL
jgi:hypothetical protein